MRSIFAKFYRTLPEAEAARLTHQLLVVMESMSADLMGTFGEAGA